MHGRFPEAEEIVKADLPPDQAAANVAYLKEMLKGRDVPRGARGSVPLAALNQPD
jgi:Flp pilus assembly protein TadD